MLELCFMPLKLYDGACFLTVAAWNWTNVLMLKGFHFLLIMVTFISFLHQLYVMTAFSCQLLYQHRYTKARVMRVNTPHGEFITPVFMPVGTRAGVNNMMPAELRAAGSQIILGG